jgi:hypothetical protein
MFQGVNVGRKGRLKMRETDDELVQRIRHLEDEERLKRREIQAIRAKIRQAERKQRARYDKAFQVRYSRPGRVIHALEQKTIANGCTPEEAAAAAAKLAEMRGTK